MSAGTQKNKTQKSKESVTEYIRTLSQSEQKQAKKLLQVFQQATGMQPSMWGTMIGFGSYHYTYASGREGDMFATGFAMRKSGPTVYIMPGYQDYSSILEKLGPHKLGKSCLYITRLEDIDTTVLQDLIRAGLQDLGQQYPVDRT